MDSFLSKKSEYIWTRDSKFPYLIADLQVEDFVFANHNQHMPAYKEEVTFFKALSNLYGKIVVKLI